jgi:AcrR family transcriptional regulator
MASKAQGLQTRARLLDAAMKQFSEHGLRDTSLDDVAAAAGVTRQGLLHYFPSKTDLVLAVLGQRDREDVEAVPADVMQGDNLPAALLAILRHDLEHPGLSQLFAVSIADGLRPEHPTHEYFRTRYLRARDALADAISRRQSSGRMTDGHEPEVLAMAVLGLLNGLNVNQQLDPETDHGAALDAILSLLEDNGAISDAKPERAPQAGRSKQSQR